MSEKEILLKAKEVFASKQFGDSLLHKKATLTSPLPIHAPGGGLHSWWVALTAGDQLIAYFQFRSDGTFMRFSSFQRHEGTFDYCPAKVDWLDPIRIISFAKNQLLTGETVGTIYLSFDGSPDRIVWVVPVTDASGKQRLIYVAGGYAYSL